MKKITSRDNQKLKSARKVRDGKIENQIFIEGLRLARETIKSKIDIVESFVTDSFLNNLENTDLLHKISAQSEIYVLSENLLKTISDTKNPQGIVLICSKPEFDKEFFVNFSKSDESPLLILLLHEINNPSNLGAIFRTAEAAGIKAVIISKNSANPFSPKSLRASMGSALRITVWEDLDFYEALEWAKKNNLTTTCADINSENNYTEIDWSKKRLLIFGSEAHGLSKSERNKIDEGLFIPMDDPVESLNLAVACGVILFEARKQIMNF